MWYQLYNIGFKDLNGGAWLVQVQGEDSLRASVTLTAAADPLVWNNGGKGEIGDCVLGGTGYLRIRIEEETEAELRPGRLLPRSATDRRVVVTRNGAVVWLGFIQPQTFDQDWVAAPYEIELPIMDTVEVLKSLYIDDTETAGTTIDLMFSAYQKAGGEMPKEDFIRTNRSQYYGRGGMVTSLPWSSAAFVPAYFNARSEDDNRVSYADVLDILLSPHGLLFQIGERWFVGAVSTEATQLSKWREITQPEEWPWVVAETMDEVDITDKIADTDNTQTLLPPPAKVTLNYEPAEGNEDFSGDTVAKLTAEYITTNKAKGAMTVVTDGGTSGSPAILRYLWIKTDNLRLPFTRQRHLWVTTYTDIRVPDDAMGREEWTTNPNYVLAPVTEERYQEWAQCIEIVPPGLVEMRNPLVVVTQRELLIVEAPVSGTTSVRTDYTLTQFVDTFAFRDELFTTDIFCLELTAKMLRLDQTKDAAVRDAEMPMPYDTVPLIQLYWTDEKGGQPKKYLRWEWENVTQKKLRSVWTDCNGYFVPPFADFDTTMWIPHSAFALSTFNDGLKFSIPGGRGYVSVRVYAGGWWYDSTAGNVRDAYLAGRIAGNYVLTDFTLQYTEISVDAINLAEWNREAQNIVRREYAGGVEELSLDFKTNAGATPTAANFRAPERGFDDSMGRAGSMRERIDIAAVRLEDTAPAMALFRFMGTTYFPAGLGCNARNNELTLKLIRYI